VVGFDRLVFFPIFSPTKTLNMDTSFFSHLNWLAVAVAAAAYFFLGALWYSMLFGKQWIRATGIDPNQPGAKSGAGAIMFMTLLIEFVICMGLGVLVYRMNLAGPWMSGLKLGLFTGVFFSATVIAISYLYQKRNTLSVIDGGYHIVGQIIAAIIICAWP
jgi:hypothetical protein